MEVEELPAVSFISVEPVINEDAVREYADLHKTTAPWTHVQARLETLSALAELITDIEEELAPDWHDLVLAIGSMHTRASNDFLGLFGRGATVC
jgi:hypothetical protein